MTDELIEAFERCTITGAQFRHRDHVKVAWTYLAREPLGSALPRFCANLRRFARANNAEHIYHETITWAFMVLINERLERMGRGGSWEEFEAANPDLFERTCLLRYYGEDTLQSALAKSTFILPCNAAADRA